jgi:hypothetical protein
VRRGGHDGGRRRAGLGRAVGLALAARSEHGRNSDDDGEDRHAKQDGRRPVVRVLVVQRHCLLPDREPVDEVDGTPPDSGGGAEDGSDPEHDGADLVVLALVAVAVGVLEVGDAARDARQLVAVTVDDAAGLGDGVDEHVDCGAELAHVVDDPRHDRRVGELLRGLDVQDDAHLLVGEAHDRGSQPELDAVTDELVQAREALVDLVDVVVVLGQPRADVGDELLELVELGVEGADALSNRSRLAPEELFETGNTGGEVGLGSHSILLSSSLAGSGKMWGCHKFPGMDGTDADELVICSAPSTSKKKKEEMV